MNLAMAGKRSGPGRGHSRRMIAVGCCWTFPGAGRRAAWAGRAGPGAGPTSLRDAGRRGSAVPAGRPRAASGPPNRGVVGLSPVRVPAPWAMAGPPGKVESGAHSRGRRAAERRQRGGRGEAAGHERDAGPNSAPGVPLVARRRPERAALSRSVATDRSRRGDGGRSAARLFCAALRPGPPRPAQRTVEHHLGPACRDPPQIGPTHALNPTADGGSAPRTPAPLLWCRAALAGRKAARAVLPALGGRAHPCARLGLAPVCVAALCWSPCGCGRAVGRVAPVLGGFSGRCVGVCGGFVLGGGFSGGGGFSWLCRGSAVGSVVASAGRVGAGRWGLPVARAGVWARVLRCRGRGGLRVCCGGVGLRVGLVGLGRFPAGRSPLCWRGVGCLRAGDRPAVAPVGRSRCVARRVGLGAGGLGRWGFRLWRGGAAAALPLRVTSVAGCRWRGGCWLQRQFSHW